jgi:anti-sigma regulatory factor (Ser/Thr protein kinase)
MRTVDPVVGRFPARPESVTAARRLVVDALVAAGAHELPDERALLDDARLLVSELATNAVTHAGTEFSVTVHVAPDALHVEVEDDGAGVPELQSGSAEHGWGLRLVADAASAWGCRALDGGKVVWFRIDT